MASAEACTFCLLARSSAGALLHEDDKVVAFQDVNPSALRHYLVIPVDHIPTVRNLQRRKEDYVLDCLPIAVEHMLKIGESLLKRDAPVALEYRFGFHQPPFNSVSHLHLHCLALPFVSRWRAFKYVSFGPVGGFIKASKLLKKIKPINYHP